MNSLKYILEVVKKKQDLKPNLTINDVLFKVMEEVLELGVEVAIHTGSLPPEKGGKDGVVGEGVDSIVAIMGVLYAFNPEINIDDINKQVKKKTKKFRKQKNTHGEINYNDLPPVEEMKTLDLTLSPLEQEIASRPKDIDNPVYYSICAGTTKKPLPTYSDTWSLPYQFPPNAVLIYGANPEWRHGMGLALHAVKYWGAVKGKGVGIIGKSLAIVTKDLRKNKHPSIPKHELIGNIMEAYEIAKINPHLNFFVGYGGGSKNLNGYSNRDMASMFMTASFPQNVFFKESFYKLMVESTIPTLTFDELGI